MRQLLGLLAIYVMGIASTGCGYTIKRTVATPQGMKFDRTVKGKAWGYFGLQALRKAEAIAQEEDNKTRKLLEHTRRKAIPTRVFTTANETVSCNYEALRYIPPITLVAIFLPLCWAEIEQAVFVRKSLLK